MKPKISVLQCDSARDSVISRGLALKRRAALSIVEVLVACSVMIIAFGGMVGSMVLINRQAFLSRLHTNARMAVQRNIDQALGEKFTDQTTPAILAITTTTGAVWDDDGGGDNKVTLITRDGTTTALASGVITRRVLSIANPNGADVRSVEFAIAYSYRGRSYNF